MISTAWQKKGHSIAPKMSRKKKQQIRNNPNCLKNNRWDYRICIRHDSTGSRHTFPNSRFCFFFCRNFRIQFQINFFLFSHFFHFTEVRKEKCFVFLFASCQFFPTHAHVYFNLQSRLNQNNFYFSRHSAIKSMVLRKRARKWAK